MIRLYDLNYSKCRRFHHRHVGFTAVHIRVIGSEVGTGKNEPASEYSIRYSILIVFPLFEVSIGGCTKPREESSRYANPNATVCLFQVFELYIQQRVSYFGAGKD